MSRPDFEDYYGDEHDGCYVKVFECEDGTWRNEVIVDCDSAGFVDTLSAENGLPTCQQAREFGRYTAVEWCMMNGVHYEDAKTMLLQV